jgi:homocitrate synthase
MHMPIRNLAIIESTLREGEQFAAAHFTLEQRRQIAHAVDDFGVEYIEVTTPVASAAAEASCREIAALPLSATVLTHTRCVPDDVRLAIDCGVGGVDLLFGTSAWLRTHSHGLVIEEILEAAEVCIELVRAAGLQVRFSCEDSFRTDPADLLRIHRRVAALGVDRVGLADTVGIATPAQVTNLVSRLREVVTCDIEFHAHNDTGCAVANSLAALEAGATHIDTTILGIGERNGIVPLSGLIARVFTVQPELVEHYRLDRLTELDQMVATMLGVDIPFTSPITAPFAFHHKAGMHTKAVLGDPRSYEPFAPERFGIQRRIMVGHQLVGRHALRQRAADLGISGDDVWLRRVTAEVKRRAGDRPLHDDEVDALLRASVGA